MVFIAVLVAGCAARGELDVPTTANPDLAETVVARTAPDRPLRVVFDWVAREGEGRFTGAGVARIEPPYRARLDLFGPRGEGYATAVVVNGDLRLPDGAEEVPIPPPALMWGVLGVVAPPERAVLQGTRVTDERTELYYAMDTDLLVYVLEGGELRSVEWRSDRRLSVRLGEAADLGVPRRATYRDVEGYTELMLTLESVETANPFPVEIWNPDD